MSRLKEVMSDIPNNTESVVSVQKELLAAANTALREKVNIVSAWYKKDTRNGIVGHWELGVHIEEILKDYRAGGQKYGPRAFNTIAAFSGEAEGSLYVCANLAATYSKVQIEEIADMVMADGITPLTFTHIRGVIGITNVQERQKVLNLALENCWTGEQLSKYVSKNVNKDSIGNNPNGRPIGKPKDLKSVIDQQLSFADDFEKRDVQIWQSPQHSVSGRLEEMDEEDYTEDLSERLGRLAYRMRQLAEAAVVRADEAEERHQEVKDALSRRYKGGAKMLKVGPEDDDDDDDDDYIDRGKSGNRRQPALV